MQQNVPTAGLRPALTPILSGRVTLLGIDERSSGLDLVLAGIFVTMRGASGRSLPELARILKTEPEILLHLEAGRVRALPPWHEISRLVTDYGQFIEIDIQPVLSRIREQTGEKSAPLRATDQRAQPVPAAAITAPHHQPRSLRCALSRPAELLRHRLGVLAGASAGRKLGRSRRRPRGHCRQHRLG